MNHNRRDRLTSHPDAILVTPRRTCSITSHNQQNHLCLCLLQDASRHSNVLKAGKAEELKNARKRRTARKAN